MKNDVVSLEYMLYKMVGAEAVSLSEYTTSIMFDDLAVAVTAFQKAIYNISEVRDQIYREYQFRVRHNQSLAKMNASYNTSVRGLNSQLAKLTGDQIKEAMASYDPISPLLNAHLAPSVYLSSTILAHIDLGDHIEAKTNLNEINRLQSILVRSIFKMIALIVTESRRNLIGDVVSYADILQEGLSAANDTVLRFTPNRGAQFSSYAHARIAHIVAKYIAKHTRTVVIPRTILDRYSPVAKAMEELNSDNLEAIAARANEINFYSKQESKNRKLKRSELYTAEEVNKLLEATQAELSLDVELGKDEYGDGAVGGILTLGDTLESSELNPEQSYELSKFSDTLKKLLRKYTQSTQEYDALVIRWGLDDGEVKGLEDAARLYRATTHEKMNKGRLSEAERKTFARIRMTEHDEEIDNILATVADVFK